MITLKTVSTCEHHFSPSSLPFASPTRPSMNLTVTSYLPTRPNIKKLVILKKNEMPRQIDQFDLPLS